jgi:hypothetical protein
MTTIHEEKTSTFYSSASYEPNSKVIVINNEGLVNEDAATLVWRKSIEFAKTNSTHGILSNAEKLKGTFSKMNSFFKNEAVPALEKTGVLYVYTGMTNDIFTRFAMNQLLKIIDTKIEIKVFATFKEATELMARKLETEVRL